MPAVKTEIDVARDLDSVYTLAREVEKFPEFMPDVESVKVLERDGGRTVTEWVGVIRQFGRKVRWVEEDEWDDETHVCRFAQTEGDFDVYKGVWSFTATEGGAHIDLELEYEYNVPLIGPLIQQVLLRIVRGNADNMLQALKKKAESGD